MSDPTRPSVAEAALVAELLLWLRARPEPTAMQASALGNVLALLFAKEAPSNREAFALVDEWAQLMKWQIHDLGVGGEHP